MLLFFNKIFLGLSFSFILQIVLAFILGSFISYSLIISGQSWARNFSNQATYSVLPLISLVITQTISGNIALSLGMVGALSIVRFRHPVKTPLELTIYFLLLTVGITITSYPGKAIFLTVFTMFVIFIHAYIKSKKFNVSKSFPNLSQIRENPEYIFDIKCMQEDKYLSQSPYLLFSYENRVQNIFNYKIAFGNKREADEFKKSIENKNNILEINFSCI